MKIITMKKRKAKGAYDMFAVLSITQLILVILIVLAVFCISRTDSSAFSGLLQDVQKIFDEDIALPGTDEIIPEIEITEPEQAEWR